MINNCLFAITRFDHGLKVTKYSYLDSQEKMTKVELDPLLKRIHEFSVCTFKNRYVMISGGKNQNGSSRKNSIIYDTERNTWLTESRSKPRLCEARYGHASCTTSKTVFIFGGRDGYTDRYLSSIEKLSLRDGPVNLWITRVRKWRKFCILSVSGR